MPVVARDGPVGNLMITNLFLKMFACFLTAFRQLAAGGALYRWRVIYRQDDYLDGNYK